MPPASEHLQLIADISAHFAASQDVGATLRYALELITRCVDAEGGALFLLDDQAGELVCKASFGPVDITGITVATGQGIVGRCVRENRAELVRDVVDDPEFNQLVDKTTGFTTHSVLCAPMSVKETSVGAIELVNKQGAEQRFSPADDMLLQSLAASAALAILNASMAERLVEHQRVRRELELAGEIQRNLLPAARHASFPVCGVNLPARVVSGDFYDFFELPDGRIVFSVGDVSGKGMNAALLMSKTASLFRCLGKRIHQPAELLAIVNEEICETITRGMFVTVVCGVYDPASGRLLLANAGHEPPLVLSAQGEFIALPAGTPPLGILPLGGDDLPIPEVEIDLDGGTLYVFTDGVTEGRLADGTRLGAERLRQLLQEGRAGTLADCLAGVVDVLQQEGDALHDDLTLLAVRGRRD